MASSFSIQNLLSSDKKTSPSSTAQQSSSPVTTPCSRTSDSASPKQLLSAAPAVIEVTVLESSNGDLKHRPVSRKRTRDSGSLGSISETSGSEGFLSDSGSPVSADSSTSDSVGNKSKRLRTAYTTSQLKGLEYYFRLCPYPDSMGRDVISRVTGIDEAKIQVWFQNRRARYRKREKPLTRTISRPISPTTLTSHTLTSPTTTHPPTLTAPKPAPHPTLTATKPAHPPTTPTTVHPQLNPAMLEAYYTAMAYQMHAIQAQTSPAPTTPCLPGYYPTLPFPYPFVAPAGFPSYRPTPTEDKTKQGPSD